MAVLPTWYPWPETETKPAPMPLLLVQGFVNTLDLEKDEDLLDASWLAKAGLLGEEAEARPEELELARAMRESVRQLLESGRGDLAPLRKVAAGCTPQLGVGSGGELEFEAPERAGVQEGLYQLLLTIRAAQQDGSWSRLRICANDECRWAFYDRSKNQQGQWCDMAVCGNRLKNREFRARRRAEP
jgi:predicted RNA-binding Zn ribbon-like protein